jgi:uncharacterized membrane protein YedE/YeeE
MTFLLAVTAGLVMGAILERGDLCFHSTLRGLVRMPQELDLFRAYLLTILIATPLVHAFRALGWIDPWIPPFSWQANLVGGTIFGIGMVAASSCITGLFYKLGHGMVGTLVGLSFWMLGDTLTYIGPLSPLRDGLQSSLSVGDQNATLINLFTPYGWVLAGLVGLVIVVWLWRSPREERGKYWGWMLLGSTLGIFLGLSWLLARWGGSNYPYGTSGVPTNAYLALTGGGSGGSVWIPVALVSLIPGAFLAARISGTLWVRGETFKRYVELGAGGFLMGVGAAIAGGCNLGHSLVGVPLLSLGSITTTVSMLLGVFLADRSIKLLSLRRARSAPSETAA